MKNYLNLDNATKTSKRFITGKLNQSGLEGYVIGLSGGIDSAVSATLAVEAIGKEKVYGLLMPYSTSSESSVTDAMVLVEKLGIDYQKYDISPMIDAYFEDISKVNRLRAGNKMARERMSILFDIAYGKNYLVLGTGNRTEICLGYTTWYGDAACSIDPIGEFYKTEVKMIAKKLDIPESIISKPPSADLWEGQTDEDEIGVTYDQIDKLLESIIDNGIISMKELVSQGFNQIDISRVISLLNRFSFKRRMPDVAPLGRIAIPEYIKIEE